MMTQKRAWWLCGAYVLLMYGTLYIMRPTVNLLKNVLGDFFNVSVLFLLIVAGFILFSSFIKKIKYRNLFSKILFLLCIVLYFFGLYYLKIPEERIHLIEYGLLAVLVLRPLGFHLGNNVALYGLSFLIVSTIGSVDEFIQYILPNRVGDVKDIVLNAFSGVLGLMLAFSLGDELVHDRPYG